MGPSEMPQIKYQNTKTKPASQKVDPHGFTAVAHPHSSAKPAEAYPPSPRLRRIALFAFIHP
jgi:hypothetical protein